MSAAALFGIARQVDDLASLGRVIDDLLAGRAESPAVLGLGEPTHGIEAFPVLRNELLCHLVERGFRSIVLETDFFAASVVDDYVAGAPADIDTVLATGFSHGFGAVPGNRELVEWLRAHNAGRAPSDRIRFHGFDAPVEYAAAPSPRRALSAVIEYLPGALRPDSARDVDALVGADADWSNEAAMFDPAASIGGSDRVRALRIAADDLGSVLHRTALGLRRADPTGYDHAVANARTAQGLLRYHAAMASPAPDRIGNLFSLRTEMMAENLLAIVGREQRRGPSVVFAHNAHLRRTQSDDETWASAGALVAPALGERYLLLASDASPDPDPGTLQHLLGAATNRRALFQGPALRAALGPSTGAGAPIVPGHIPLTPADVADADAVIFIADTDGRRHRYW